GAGLFYFYLAKTHSKSLDHRNYRTSLWDNGIFGIAPVWFNNDLFNSLLIWFIRRTNSQPK
ncbi:MAG: hypothetical protein ACXWRA_11620, partial [Pseudobdellovibrionaceae bacterium]